MSSKFAENVDRLLTDLGSVLKAKNQDYGCSVFQPCDLAPELPIEMAMYVRIGDKINRLKTLLGGDEEPATGEAIDDTILDLAGYLVLLLMYRKDSNVGTV